MKHSSQLLAQLVTFLMASLLVHGEGSTHGYGMGIGQVSDSIVLNVTGPLNELFVLEASPNLVDWAPIRTNSLRGNVRDIEVPASSSASFFRSRLYEENSGCSTPECSIRFQERDAADGSCPIKGTPDLKEIRDAAIPRPNTPVKTVRLIFQIIATDTGAREAIDPDRLLDQVLALNKQFAPWRIQFTYESKVVRSSMFLKLESEEKAENAKQILFLKQASHQNIMVVESTWDGSAYAIYPWDPRALTSRGGIVIEGRLLGPLRTALAHELGHSLGLYHTHHGVSEVDSVCPGCDPCLGCYESADGSRGDVAGDRCSDTPATPKNFDCAPPKGIDERCSRLPWATVGYRNYMSYANCRSEFTPQQAGRMHAWINHNLTGWVDHVTPPAPSDLVAVTTPFGEVLLSWSDNSTNETSYAVERFTEGSSVSESIPLVANTTVFSDPTAQPSSTISYRIRAFNSNIPSYYSQTVTVKTPGIPGDLIVDGRNDSPPFTGTELDPFQTIVQLFEESPPNTARKVTVQAGSYRAIFPANPPPTRFNARGGNVLFEKP